MPVHRNVENQRRWKKKVMVYWMRRGYHYKLDGSRIIRVNRNSPQESVYYKRASNKVVRKHNDKILNGNSYRRLFGYSNAMW